jgi:hypothetical protein
MKATITKTEWTYYVCVSKDNPHNPNRGFDLPDTKYHRQHHTGIGYTEKEDAIKSLMYYQKGFVERKRHITTRYEYGGGTNFSTETQRVMAL